jgi:hypothetical protein
MQAPREEQGPADFVDMGQPARVEMRHETAVPGPRKVLRKRRAEGPIINRPQVANPPHEPKDAYTVPETGGRA